MAQWTIVATATVTIVSTAFVAPVIRRQSECTAENVATRVSFVSMPPEERKAYTDAINCIHDLPSNLDQNQNSAAVSRYQDYAVVHVQRTGQVHLSGFFLTWHRYFLYLFE